MSYYCIFQQMIHNSLYTFEEFYTNILALGIYTEAKK